ncbi:MAG: RecX family transcriptional regulator [Bryobacteraceae bacterium]
MPVKRAMLDEAALMEYAGRLLSGRAYSSGEIREKLRRRAARPGDVDTVVANLRCLGYLNDRGFAENFAAARLENEGQGRARVLRDLRQHRVAPAVAEAAVDRTYKDQDEVALIEAFLARKFRGASLCGIFRRQLPSRPEALRCRRGQPGGPRRRAGRRARNRIVIESPASLLYNRTETSDTGDRRPDAIPTGFAPAAFPPSCNRLSDFLVLPGPDLCERRTAAGGRAHSRFR